MIDGQVYERIGRPNQGPARELITGKPIMKDSQNAELQESRSEGEDRPEKKSGTLHVEQLQGLLEETMAMLEPLTTFHQPVEGAADGDVRVHWDLRIVRGKGEFFVHETGTSTLPGLLDQRALKDATSRIQQEVMDKMAAPLIGKMQAEVEEWTSKELVKREEELGIAARAVEAFSVENATGTRTETH